MKKGVWLFALLWVLILSGCGGSMNVVEYNDSFVSLVKECTDSNQEFFNVYQSNNSTIDSISESINKCIEICESAKERASEIWDFEKDSSLKDGVVDLLSAEVEYLTKFGNTRRYWNIDDLSQEDKDAYNWVVNDLYESESILNSKFISLQNKQEAFAAKHGLRLE